MNQTSIIDHQRQAAERASRGADLARAAPHLGAPARPAPTQPTPKSWRRSKRPDTRASPRASRPPPGRKPKSTPAIPPAGSIRVRAHSRSHPRRHGNSDPMPSARSARIVPFLPEELRHVRSVNPARRRPAAGSDRSSARPKRRSARCSAKRISSARETCSRPRPRPRWRPSARSERRRCDAQEVGRRGATGRGCGRA